MYRVHESVCRAELLLGAGVTIDGPNDAFGQALDKLCAAGAAAVYSALCVPVAVLDVRHEFRHWHSTNRSFYGNYDERSGGAVNIAHGQRVTGQTSSRSS